MGVDSVKGRRSQANLSELERCINALQGFGATLDGFADAGALVDSLFAHYLGGAAPQSLPEERSRQRFVAQLAFRQAQRIPRDRLDKSGVTRAIEEIAMAIETLQRFEQTLEAGAPDRLWLDLCLITVGRAEAQIDTFLERMEAGRQHGEKPGSRGWVARQALIEDPTLTARDLMNRGDKRSPLDRRYVQRLVSQARKLST